MATTPDGAALTEAHRVAQTGISAGTVALMVRLWPMLGKGTPTDENTRAWLDLVLAVIRGRRALSARLASVYVDRFRALELPGEPAIRVVPQISINEEQVITSLMVMGPQAVRREIAAYEARQASRAGTFTPPEKTVLPRAIDQKIAANVARAAMRHVRNGERDTIDEVVKEDRVARGFVRVTDGDPCFFCAMLASRGPVFKDFSFEESDPRFQGPGNQKVHDGCGCSIEPVYRGDTAWPGRAKEFEALWMAATAGKSGSAARKAFRQAYEKLDKH